MAAALAPSFSVQKVADWVREVTEREGESRTETVAEDWALSNVRNQGQSDR